jgi:hypothetical protein
MTMGLCKCEVCKTIGRVDKLCDKLSSADAKFVREIWERMATTEEDLAWIQAKTESHAWTACPNPGSLSFNLPDWAAEAFSAQAQKQNISIDRLCLDMLLPAAANLSEEYLLQLERWKVATVLRNKLVQLQSLLSEFSHEQLIREKSASSFVDSLFSV